MPDGHFSQILYQDFPCKDYGIGDSDHDIDRKNDCMDQYMSMAIEYLGSRFI